MAKFLEKMDVKVLEDTCYDKKTMNLIVNYSDEQLAELKSEFFAVSKQIDEKISILDEIKDILMADAYDSPVKDLIIAIVESSEIDGVGIKTLKKRQKDLMNRISKGWSEENRVCYLLEDYESEKMAIYLETGELYTVRDLEQSEKQTRLKKVI